MAFGNDGSHPRFGDGPEPETNEAQRDAVDHGLAKPDCTLHEQSSIVTLDEHDIWAALMSLGALLKSLVGNRLSGPSVPRSVVGSGGSEIDIALQTNIEIEYEWFEVWTSDFDGDLPYFLIVTKDDRGLHKIHDIKAGTISFCHHDYQEIVYWLFEDEFSNKIGQRTYHELEDGDASTTEET